MRFMVQRTISLSTKITKEEIDKEMFVAMMSTREMQDLFLGGKTITLQLIHKEYEDIWYGRPALIRQLIINYEVKS